MAVMPDSRFRRRDRVVHRDLKDGAVLLNLDDGSYFEVNPVGLLVWDAIDDNDVAGIVEMVCAAFPDAPPAVTDDVVTFVQALADKGLIRSTGHE
jgi:hypothetical protein